MPQAEVLSLSLNNAPSPEAFAKISLIILTFLPFSPNSKKKRGRKKSQFRLPLPASLSSLPTLWSLQSFSLFPPATLVGPVGTGPLHNAVPDGFCSSTTRRRTRRGFAAEPSPPANPICRMTWDGAGLPFPKGKKRKEKEKKERKDKTLTCPPSPPSSLLFGLRASSEPTGGCKHC